MDDMWKQRATSIVQGPEVTVHLHDDDDVLMVGVLVDVSGHQEGNWEITAPLLDTFYASDYDSEELERIATLLEAAAARVRALKSDAI